MPSLRSKEDRYRSFMLLSVGLYLAWWIIMRVHEPPTDDPISHPAGICGLVLAFWGITALQRWRRFTVPVFNVIMLLPAGHALFHAVTYGENEIHIIAAIVIVSVVANAVETFLELAIYTSVTLALVWILPGTDALRLSRLYLTFALLTSHISSFVVLGARLRLLRTLHRNKAALSHAQALAQIGSYAVDYDPTSPTNPSFFSWSRQAAINCGFPPESSMNDVKWETVIHPDDRERVYAAWQSAMDTKQQFENEFRIIKPNGGEGVIKSIGKPIFDAHGQIVRMFGTMQDITSIRAMERKVEEQRRQLLHGEKLKHISRLVANIAHEINTPLTVIHSSASQAKKLLIANETRYSPIEHALAKVEKGVQKVSDIILSLKVLMEDTRVMQMKNTPLQPLITDAVESLTPLFSMEAIELRCHGVNPDLSIDCIPEHISAAIHHILMHAISEVRGKPSPWIEVATHREGQHVAVVIRDSSEGLPVGLAAQIMQPLSEVAEFHDGLGIGLFISKLVAESHGGNLFINSNSPKSCLILKLGYVHDPKKVLP